MDSKLLLATALVVVIAAAGGYMALTGKISAPSTGNIIAPGTAALYGRLIDKATRMPIPGEYVRLGDVIYLTDEQGSYEITGIEPGTHTVVWGGLNYYAVQSPELFSEGQAMERDIKLSKKEEAG